MNTNCTDYEWIVEPVNEYEDVMDVIHCAKFKDTFYYLEGGVASYGKDCVRIEIALRKRLYRYEDLDEQYYNYLKLENGIWSMAEYWEDFGCPTEVKVPKRFFKELDVINKKEK